MMARALIHNGAKEVFILGRRLALLQAASRANPGLTPLQCDITSKDSLQSAVDSISSSTGYLNLLIVNSGIGGTSAHYSYTPNNTSISELRRELFTDHSMEDFTNTFAVNVSGAFFTMMAFLELLDHGNRHALLDGYGGLIAPGMAVPAVQSQIVVTSSISAYIRGNITPPSYGASKAAVLYLAKQASSQLAGYGIRVNALAPGCKSLFW
jgi:NAD(P)-dependent dehydrogenase (short-subunit alcohol dehydrogenase family)